MTAPDKYLAPYNKTLDPSRRIYAGMLTASARRRSHRKTDPHSGSHLHVRV